MQEHSVLLTEVAGNPVDSRVRAVTTLLEGLGCPSVALANHSVLSLYATSTATTGIVLDSGAAVTRAVRAAMPLTAAG